jgi:hypothetical protein
LGEECIRKLLVASMLKNSFLKKSSFAKASEDNRRVATTPLTEPIQVLFKIAKVLQGYINKKEVENDLLSTLAPQVREQLFHSISL